MSEETEVAPETAATGEVVEAEAQEVEATEASENTEGQPEDGRTAEEEEKAKADTEAEEKRKSRRQRQKEAFLRTRAERDAAEKEARRATEEAEKLRKAIGSMQQPKLDQYASFEEFQAALTAHAMARGMDERAVRNLEEAAREQSQKAQAARQQEAQATEQAVMDMISDGMAKYADFDQVVRRPHEQGGPKITAAMAEMLADSDWGADVAYALGKNPALSAEIAAMSPTAQARAIGRLEAQVSAPKPKKVTSAPDPVNPVTARAPAPRSPEKMTPDEYAAWRAKGGTFTL